MQSIGDFIEVEEDKAAVLTVAGGGLFDKARSVMRQNTFGSRASWTLAATGRGKLSSSRVRRPSGSGQGMWMKSEMNGDRVLSRS